MSDLLTLDSLLARAASEHPTSGIFDNGGVFLSWPEVHDQAQSLAACLIRAGVEPGDRVLVHHPRSAASFIGVHGVLMAGAVMVPLDPFGPPDAIATVVDAVEPAAMICSNATVARHDVTALASAAITIVCNGDTQGLIDQGIPVDQIHDFAEVATAGECPPERELNPQDRAYIIFTSGSTGVPKGIVHTHASGLAYASMAAQAHAITPDDRLAAISPLHFDQSTLDLYAAPFAGASVVMTSEAELRFPASLSKRLESTRASIVYTTPYQLQQLVNRGDIGNRDVSWLRQVAFGGEAFAPQTLVELGRHFPDAELVNVYGPAEVNGVTVHSFGRAPASLDAVSIGLPCAGVEVVLVDDAGNSVESLASGEMLVSSPTMMMGYWRRPDLNADCFVERDDQRFYRTGDHGHVDAHGQLQFEGRRDNLIKVRGVRIELEAIERVLDDAPGVAHSVAVLVSDDDGMQRIIGAIVPQDGALDPDPILVWCRERLPANAVPTSLHEVRSLPTTATGKIDRASLRDSLVTGDSAAQER